MERNTPDTSIFSDKCANAVSPKKQQLPTMELGKTGSVVSRSGCSRTLPSAVQHVFWTCSSARRHWEHLLFKWRSLGGFNITDFNVWLFGLDLPEVPHKAWDAIKRTFARGVEMTAAKDAVFPAVRELWRSAVSTTLHAIWSERLRRMDDPSLTEETHIARA